jgi:hypothetical protein
MAAELAGLNRHDFIQALSRFEVLPIQETAEELAPLNRVEGPPPFGTHARRRRRHACLRVDAFGAWQPLFCLYKLRVKMRQKGKRSRRQEDTDEQRVRTKSRNA